MSNVPVPFYYSQFTAKERSYVDYMGEINKSISSEIESSANRQIAANALFAGELKSTLIDNQIATEKVLYNNMQQLDNTLTAGFSGVSMRLQSGLSDVSRQLGYMGSAMSMAFDQLNGTVLESSRAICNRLDDINETLKNPLFTGFRELYNRALKNYSKGLFEEVLEDLHEAINKNKTDPFSHFLLGQTYLYGIGEFSNVIDLNAAIESLKNAVRYITSDAKTHKEARLVAAEIWFYLGLAYQTKANDEFHNKNKTGYEKNLNEAKTAYSRSWDYSQNMLESLYNLARGKALTNDKDGAIQDLKNVILRDHGYCLKVFADSDFDNALKDTLFSQIKRELYPQVKPVFDRIQSTKNIFQGPYSHNLTQLINKCLPNTFTEDTPPFDMLEASVFFPKILSVLESERKAYIEKIQREEQERQERKRQDEKEQQEQKRREEQERQERKRQDEKEQQEQKRREEQERQWRKENARAEAKKKRKQIFLTGFSLILGGIVGGVVFSLYYKFMHGNGGLAGLFVIIFLVSGYFIAGGWLGVVIAFAGTALLNGLVFGGLPLSVIIFAGAIVGVLIGLYIYKTKIEWRI